MSMGHDAAFENALNSLLLGTNERKVENLQLYHAAVFCLNIKKKIVFLMLSKP